MILLLLACFTATTPADPTVAPGDGCARYSDGEPHRLDPDCPCADIALLLDGWNVSHLPCRPDQRIEWGSTPAEDGNVAAVCRCVR